MPEFVAEPPDERDRGPLVTIGMPIYNAGSDLRLAVASILQQTFPDWELIIIDDGSSDGAADGIRDICDSRIRILRDGLNRGLAARLNEAIDLARGRYFARMDQDDISYPERFARQLAMLQQNPHLDLVGVCCLAISADDELVGALPFALTHEEISATPWKGFYLAHPTWMGRTEWFRQHRYAIPGPYFCEDQELLLRTYHNSQFATVPEILFAYRVRSRIDWNKSYWTRKAILRIQLRHFLSMRQWHFVVLSALMFVTRVTMDSINTFLQKCGGEGIWRYRIKSVDASVYRQWCAVSEMIIRVAR